jgi:hypothetical protein
MIKPRSISHNRRNDFFRETFLALSEGSAHLFRLSTYPLNQWMRELACAFPPKAAAAKDNEFPYSLWRLLDQVVAWYLDVSISGTS